MYYLQGGSLGLGRVPEIQGKLRFFNSVVLFDQKIHSWAYARNPNPCFTTRNGSEQAISDPREIRRLLHRLMGINYIDHAGLIAFSSIYARYGDASSVRFEEHIRRSVNSGQMRINANVEEFLAKRTCMITGRERLRVDDDDVVWDQLFSSKVLFDLGYDPVILLSCGGKTLKDHKIIKR